MLMDVIQNIQFPSSKIFKLYCERVAVALDIYQLKFLELIQRLEINMHMNSVWLQITNIVRDFHEDLNNKRCYIPSEKFEKYGLKKDLKRLLI